MYALGADPALCSVNAETLMKEELRRHQSSKSSTVALRHSSTWRLMASLSVDGKGTPQMGLHQMHEDAPVSYALAGIPSETCLRPCL